MTEDYLHFIWKYKRIPITLKLIDGRDVSITDFGIHNRIHSGPDFSMGTILLDGLKFVGPIELHVKSSDWYRHNHHKDDSYNNVTLHVVYEYDTDVIQAGRILPTIELKDLLDEEHYFSFVSKKFKSSNFICETTISIKDKNELEFMKSKALELKFNSKWKELNINYQSNPEEIFYKLVCRAFGMGTNKKAFQLLSNKIEFNEVCKLSVIQIYSLLMSESGLINNRMNKDYKWDFCGTRPANFPNVRINQLASFLSLYQFDILTFEKTSVEIIKHVEESLSLIFSSSESWIKNPGKSFYKHILINVYVPFIWLTNKKNSCHSLNRKHLEILNLLSAEKNNIIEKWKRTNVKIENAFDSQSIIALVRHYCSHKKCLSCAVGEKILSPS